MSLVSLHNRLGRDQNYTCHNNRQKYQWAEQATSKYRTIFSYLPEYISSTYGYSGKLTWSKVQVDIFGSKRFCFILCCILSSRRDRLIILRNPCISMLFIGLASIADKGFDSFIWRCSWGDVEDCIRIYVEVLRVVFVRVWQTGKSNNGFSDVWQSEWKCCSPMDWTGNGVRVRGFRYRMARSSDLGTHS